MLRPDAQRLWAFLKERKALAGFVLVGGSALAMDLQHRHSEDLDFMIPQPRLPRVRIKALLREGARSGFTFTPNDPVPAVEEFIEAGLDLNDYQQSFVVSAAVKVTLVAPDPEVASLLRAGSTEGPRVASLEELFRLKCLACANRSKTRDWLDLFVLLDRGLFQPLDVYRTFELAQVPAKFDLAMMRLCSGAVPPDDEGFESTLRKTPSLTAMRKRFIQVRDQIEQEVARLKKEGGRG